MKSYLGNPELKAATVAKIRGLADRKKLKQRFYWDPSNECGCAVGSMTGGMNHEKFEEELGIPYWLAYTLDHIFEGLPLQEARKFACDFFEAIPVGVDLDPIQHTYALYLLDIVHAFIVSLPIRDASKLGEIRDSVLDSIKRLIEMHASQRPNAEPYSVIHDQLSRQIRDLQFITAELASYGVESAKLLAEFTYSARYVSGASHMAVQIANAIDSVVEAIRIHPPKAKEIDYTPFSDELLNMLRKADKHGV